MKTAIAYTSYIIALCVGLTGCGTPQAALDQANNGAALTMSLQSELQNFRAVQANVAKARIDSVRKQSIMLATYDADAAFDERALKVAGKDDALKLYTTLKELADSRGKDEQALNAKITEMDESFSKLLSPLPDATQKLTATQKALAVLGSELSAKERIVLVASFAKSIKQTIDDNKKKIDAAAYAAPDAKSQSAAQIPPGK